MPTKNGSEFYWKTDSQEPNKKKMLRIKRKMEELKLFENLKVRKVFGNRVRKLLLK